ncbi:PREDICTED: uncharacterized protein LOC18587244 [Theobroma cacao]|uniref:Uncharacterized protein LOC18587244 n=1 Tax=Theobroma cacao TaxID=3641 RepID=A0AB32WYP1_THECC|nr:PREDICTED: uncharacterized protein LOC18587244 [Theobroma cacao]
MAPVHGHFSESLWRREIPVLSAAKKVDHFLGRGVRPEDEPNISDESGTGTGTGTETETGNETETGDQESPWSPEMCICQRRWDSNNSRQSSPHLPEGEKGFYVRQGVPLFKATLNGDREKTQQILNRNERTLLRSSLTEGHETALHVAVGARQAAVVKELVGRMESQDLELRDGRGNTALCVAVATGSVKIAKILMEKNAELAFIRGADNKTPLYIAALKSSKDLYWNLGLNFADLAIKILKVLRDLAWARDSDDETALGILARKPSAFAGESSTPKTLIAKCFGTNTISMQNTAIELTKLLCETMSSDERKSFGETIDHASKLLFEAARLGNYKFLAVLIGSFPDLIFRKDETNKSIFHIAVLHRHASIFNHIHNLGLQKDLIMLYRVRYPDQENTSIIYIMLHLAAKLPSLDRLSIVSGAALQMQRELLWFKEVENLTQPSEREKRDSRDKLTPRELFTKEHEELRKAGEKWMKSTAQSGMIVATLITAVVFTTASSVPGGTNDKDGTPRDITKTMFHVFAVSDSVAMCSSIISTLMFLSIITSRYAEEDFLVRLPLKLAAGLTALLVSMMALMVSFSAIYFLNYSQLSKLKWVPVLTSALSFLPAALFVLLQYHLLHDVFRSTFGSKHIFRPDKSTF